MSMSEVSHWFEGQNSWLTFVGISAILVIIVIPVINVYSIQVLWSQIPISEGKCNFDKTITVEQNYRDHQTSTGNY